MAVEFYIPKLGQTVEEVTLIRWLVDDGARVKVGQEIVEVQTDKTIFPVEANAAGYLHRGPYRENDVVPVLTVVAIIGAPDDAFEAPDRPLSIGTSGETTVSLPASPVAPGGESTTTARPPVAPPSADRIFVSPRARNLARETVVDLMWLTPTGGGGVRIREQDVRDYLALARRASPVASERTSAHAGTAARVTLVTEVDADRLVQLGGLLQQAEAGTSDDGGAYTGIIVKCVAVALRTFPYMNARLVGNVIHRLGSVNVGVIVDTDRGTPALVIRDADAKTPGRIGQEIRELAARARSGEITTADPADRTFTLTNLGRYDVDASTPMVDALETASLGIGRVTSKPVVRGGEITVRATCTLSLSFDHRLVDGAPAARFLQRVKQLIEQPHLLLL